MAPIPHSSEMLWICKCRVSLHCTLHCLGRWAQWVMVTVRTGGGRREPPPMVVLLHAAADVHIHADAGVVFLTLGYQQPRGPEQCLCVITQPSGLGRGSVIVHACSSYRGPGFDSRYPYGGPQSSVGTHVVPIHTYRQNTHAHKIRSK